MTETQPRSFLPVHRRLGLELGTHLPVEWSPICSLQPRSVFTDQSWRAWGMLSNGKATASVSIILVCSICLVTALDTELSKPRHILWMFTLKAAHKIVTWLTSFCSTV